MGILHYVKICQFTIGLMIGFSITINIYDYLDSLITLNKLQTTPITNNMVWHYHVSLILSHCDYQFIHHFHMDWDKTLICNWLCDY
jgi:hypothetical protein